MSKRELPPGHATPLGGPAGKVGGSLTDDAGWTALALWVALARAQGALAAMDQVNLDRHGLTRGEFGVLDVLFFKGAQLLGEIQRKLLVSSGGITYLVGRLEEKGLVQRRPSPADRRAVYAVLTPEGEALFRAIFPEHANSLAESVSALAREEQVELARLLKRVGKGAAQP